MQDILAVIGVVSGVVSLLTVLYLAGVWKGRVDNTLADCCRRLQEHPPEETALMVKTIWEIYVVDTLRSRPDLAEHHSDFKLTQEAVDLIPPELKTDLDKIPPTIDGHNDVATGYLVVKFLGLPTIERFADGTGLSVQEAIAILSCYVADRLKPR